MIEILEVVANVIRMMTATSLIAAAVYLQFVPEPPNKVPIRYRWPPFILGVLLLDWMRYGSRFSGDVMVILIFCSFLYLMWVGFALVARTYNVYPPHKHIARRLMDGEEWIQRKFG